MDSFPECIVCKKQFEWKGPEPFLLPCLHAVCQTCLNSAESNSLHCDSCQRYVDLKKTTLRKDRVRERRTLHLTAKHRPSEVLCTHEDDGNQAVCWCLECDVFLCEHCQNVHEGFKANKRHNVLGIGETGLLEEDGESYCRIHNKYVLELFDKDCGVLICYKCKHGEHAGHSTEDMDTMSRASRHELQELIKVMTDVKDKTQERLNENGQHVIQLNEDTASHNDKIVHIFKTMKELVDHREKEISLAFENHVEMAKTTNSERRSALILHQNVCLHILEYTQHVLEHASKHDYPSIMPTIKDIVTECSDSDLHKKKQQRPTVMFLLDDFLDTKSALSWFSGISYNGQVVSATTNEGKWLSYGELQKKCYAHEVEIASLKDHITALESSLMEESKRKELEAKEASILQKHGISINVTCHFLLVDLKTITKSSILQCVHVSYSEDMVNIKYAHINKIGKLVNCPPAIKPKEKYQDRLWYYDGTGSTMPLSWSGCPQYLEIKTRVGIHKTLSGCHLIMEIALCWKQERDKSHYMGKQRHSYVMDVTRCEKHESICRQVRQEGKPVLCLQDTIPNVPGLTSVLHYGVVFDDSRKKIVFIDVKECLVVAVLENVDTRQPLWPLFGVYNPEWLTVDMELLSGKEIRMTETKKIMILRALQ